MERENRKMNYIKIKKLENSKFGIGLELGDKLTPIEQKTPDGFYHLPENPICKYIMVDLVNFHLKDKDEFILNDETRSARKFGVKNSVEKKIYPKGEGQKVRAYKLSLETCEEFLQTDEERDQWNDIMGIIRERYEEKIRAMEAERQATSKVDKAKAAALKQLEILKAAGIDISALLG